MSRIQVIEELVVLLGSSAVYVKVNKGNDLVVLAVMKTT